MVSVVSPGNISVFSDYILPKLAIYISNDTNGGSAFSPPIRCVYGSCLASLAENAYRFLDIGQTFRLKEGTPSNDVNSGSNAVMESYHQSFDVLKSQLMSHFERQATALMTDSDSAVKRAFLPSVVRLCIFFGKSRANDVLLSHLNTYLNDKDWILKLAFFDTIVSVATYVGSINFEEYILPLMIQALADPEEFILEKVLKSFAHLAHIGIFQRVKTWEILSIVAPFTMHPNMWIREAAVSTLANCVKWLSEADLYSIVSPLLQPFLRSSVRTMSDISILENLKKPLPRNILDAVLVWAVKAENSSYWVATRRTKTGPFGRESTSILSNLLDSTSSQPGLSTLVMQNEEDEAQIVKLRNIGMTTEDEARISVLKDYIMRLAPNRSRANIDSSNLKLNNVISLREINVTRQTIFFDEKYADAQRALVESKNESHLPDARLTKKVVQERHASISNHVTKMPQPLSKYRQSLDTGASLEGLNTPKQLDRVHGSSNISLQGLNIGKTTAAVATDNINITGVVDKYSSGIHPSALQGLDAWAIDKPSLDISAGHSYCRLSVITYTIHELMML